MLALGLLFLWASPSLAGNSTATEGWQHNGNTRSTWDISWACLSTVLACTWTVLHRDVPARNISNFRISFGKFVSLFLAIMAPELVAWIAVQELQRARSTASRCTSSQTLSDRVTKEPTLRAHQRTKPIAQAQSDSNNDSALSPSSHSTWTVAQGFCINMGGLAMQTEDEWTYPVEPDTAQLLVEAGFIRCSDFRERDIQDRSKADSFAKAFTVLQSTWSTVNIVARAAYNLPISPLELSIVAYVSCALFTYAFWWHKPKDMTTPITVNLRCTRNNLPQELQNITNANPKKWIHLRVVPAKESIFSLPQIIRQWYDGVKAQEQTRGPPAGSPSKFSSRDEALLDAFGVLASILFCGIHIAAYVSSTRCYSKLWLESYVHGICCCFR